MQVEEYSNALEEVLIKREDGMKYMPELYAVPSDKVHLYTLLVLYCYGCWSVTFLFCYYLQFCPRFYATVLASGTLWHYENKTLVCSHLISGSSFIVLIRTSITRS